jgi:hypothetical protein
LQHTLNFLHSDITKIGDIIHHVSLFPQLDLRCFIRFFH